MNNFKLARPLFLVGLGNWGSEYEKTRHNAGFLFIDKIQAMLDGDRIDFTQKETPLYWQRKYSSQQVILFKPKTMMNLSGKAVKDYLKNSNLGLESLVLVHDDLDIELGKYKLQLEKSPKMHNGISSVENELGTKAFWRLRLGIENRGDDYRIPGLDYVLQKFTDSEILQVEKVFSTAQQQLQQTFI